jgi:DNA mismatch repair ATPase MutS
MINIAQLLYELDCYLALSDSATCYSYVRPIITEDDECILETSRFILFIRHPIMELILDHFVPNTISFQNKTIAITGPNASGKSVLMQQVALITFLAHIGSFVPCSHAIIPITDKILTKIRTPTTISSQESSFYTDLRQACVAVTECTSKSLVLLDEFGKGTIPSDGIGLFCAIIRDINEKHSRFILSTHFFEMFALNQMKFPNLAFFTFRMYVDQDDIEFMFELEQGKCRESLGILCAKRAGMEDDIVERGILI